MTRPGPRHAAAGRASWKTAVVGPAAVGALCVLVLAAGAAAGRPQGAPVPSPAPASASASATAGGGEATAAVGVRAGAASPEVPRGVQLPSGLRVAVRPVSTTGDGTLDVPGDIDVAGWWRGGSRVGDPFGSVLVAAHVDSSAQGLGPFAELLSVTAGESIVVTTAHLSQEYVVTELRLLDQGPLAEHAWVYSPSGPHRLTLVTCAGAYDPSRGGYQRLAVVTAMPVGQPSPRESR